MHLVYDWPFPLPRTHTGMLLGNAVMGVMVWGEGNVLRVTFNRADFWDHRGGRVWTETMSFPLIRRLLEANDAEGLKQAFAIKPPRPGEPAEPSHLPLGRIEVTFDPSCRLTKGTVDFATGRVTVTVENGQKRTHIVEIDLAMDRPLLSIRWPAEMKPTVGKVTAWDYPRVAGHLKKIGFQPPTSFDEQNISGWTQTRVAPGDDPLAVAWTSGGSHLWLSMDWGPDVAAAKSAVRLQLEQGQTLGLASLRKANDAWWSQYWADVPKLQIPDPNLAFLYAYGMYKFAGLTHPAGLPAGLQGPWLEEYQMLPWGADYHFNINVQMCYQPAYAGNRLSHLLPLFKLIESWMPKLRENAKKFVGIDDGLVLPHAVDDRCDIIGVFWTGTIDHACTAWVGKMMFDYWLYGGGDEDFLRRTAYPFLVGAMRVYEEMLERGPDGKFVLPVSVSPEYRAAQMNAWGRNASFQLGCIHWLLRALRRCCKVLGEPPRPVWEQIERDLPLATVKQSNQHILMWEGTELEESHRHHSFIAGITPFDVIDPSDPTWKPIVDATIDHWIRMGMGLWSGWCMPWAAMIHQRVGNPDMAALTLEIWRRVFTNVGHGTLHDCEFDGLTLIGGKRYKNPNEVMQMDAGMGATAGLLDGMAYTQAGVVHLFGGAPASWAEVGFDGIRVEGAFLLSAKRVGGIVESVKVISERGGTLRLANPWKGNATIARGDRRETIGATVLEIPTRSGESLSILPG